MDKHKTRRFYCYIFNELYVDYAYQSTFGIYFGNVKCHLFWIIYDLLALGLSMLKLNILIKGFSLPIFSFRSPVIQSYMLSLNMQVGVQGLQILKPHTQKKVPSSMVIANGVKELNDTIGGIGLEVRLILCEENVDDETTNWEVENLKFSVGQPVMRTVDLSMGHCLSFIR